jgi:hypothetical protein
MTIHRRPSKEDAMTAQPELVGYAKYVPGKRMYFPYASSSIYVITAVDTDAQTVTFAPPYDREDEITETITDLESVDVRVLS